MAKTTGKLPLLFGIHCHQPVDNFDHVIDHATTMSYLPFLQAAKKVKSFKFSVHYSGWLLEWIRVHRPEAFSLLQELSASGQIEFFGGGFYEPVLSSIPSNDRIGQITMLSDYIEKHFNQRPKGLWLTERVWDPAIVPDAVGCGMEYVIVDDYHFISAGYHPEMLHGFYLTEQDGHALKVFPIDKKMRYLTPFKPVEVVLDHLKAVKHGGGACTTIFDDGEKFGIWPDTYEWVYDEGWLADFLKTVSKDPDVRFAHYRDVAAEEKPAGIAYLPITSYAEMGEWSLFAERAEEIEKLKKGLKKAEWRDAADVFVKGGIWKNFLAKYPESNRIHKRGLGLSVLARDKKPDPVFQNALYAAQCNDVLWHGIFGGLYLPNLRNNAWRYLIRAESRLIETGALKVPSVTIADVDYDGFEEAIVRMPAYTAMFLSRDCGQLGEFSLRDREFNLQNTLTRRREGYHHKLFEDADDHGDDTGISTIHDNVLAIDEETKKLVVHDWYNRNSFIDHIVAGFSSEDFRTGTFRELSDFANQPAAMNVSGQKLTFVRKGGIFTDAVHDVTLKKTYAMDDDGFSFEISLSGDVPAGMAYVLECNLHLPHLSGTTVNGASVAEPGSTGGTTFTVADDVLGGALRFSFDQDVTVHHFLVKTVSQSESGVELTDQGVCLLVPVSLSGSMKLTGRVSRCE